ncbi:MAG: AraC family transcriptional regulator [Agriterribacter sp.]
MQKKNIKKRSGFEGQKAIVVPRTVLMSNCQANTIIDGLHITDIGYYPKARFHYRKRLHGAEQHILIYCVKGKGSVTIKKEQYTIEPGNFFIIPRNIEHYYQAHDIDPWTIYWIHFAGKASDDIVAYMQQLWNSHKSFVHYSEHRIELFNTIYNQFERGYGIEDMVYANMCLYNYLGSYLNTEKSSSVNTHSEIDFVNRVIDFMKKNIDSMCTLQQMANEVNISPSHLSFLFKKRTGYPPIEYFNHLKVQQACQYLMFTGLRVKEIASLLGMDDPYYFSRFFTKLMGLSPNMYREKRNQ